MSLSKAISFGINEQILTLMCALSGILKQDKKHIIYLILSFAIASSIPDVYSYASTSSNKTDENAFKDGLYVFLTEMIMAFILGIPLIFFRQKEYMFLGAITVGLSMISLNEIYFLNSDIEKTIKSVLFASLSVIVSYMLSYILRSFFNFKN